MSKHNTIVKIYINVNFKNEKKKGKKNYVLPSLCLCKIKFSESYRLMPLNGLHVKDLRIAQYTVHNSYFTRIIIITMLKRQILEDKT